MPLRTGAAWVAVPILLDVRRSIPLIAIVGAVVGGVVAALVWQLWPSDRPPSGPPRPRTYSSAHELACGFYRARGESQHPQLAPPLPHSYVYRCPVAGGRWYFFVYTQALVEDLKATFGKSSSRRSETSAAFGVPSVETTPVPGAPRLRGGHRPQLRSHERVARDASGRPPGDRRDADHSRSDVEPTPHPGRIRMNRHPGANADPPPLPSADNVP
jgi:hypothetical protein